MTDDFYIPPVMEAPVIIEEEKADRRTSFISCATILTLIVLVLILTGHLGATGEDFGRYAAIIVAGSLGYSYARKSLGTMKKK